MKTEKEIQDKIDEIERSRIKLCGFMGAFADADKQTQIKILKWVLE